MEPHYTFHIELRNLNKRLLNLTALVEDRVRRAAAVVKSQEKTEVQSIILSDYEIDEMEIEIEEDCLKIMALHQPVASDLTIPHRGYQDQPEMERIADMAVNIAMCVEAISKSKAKHLLKDIDFSDMSEKTIAMLRMSLDALVNRDALWPGRYFCSMMKSICSETKCTAGSKILSDITLNIPDVLINTYLLALHLERIGDRATNISEEVIYLVEGVVTKTIS